MEKYKLSKRDVAVIPSLDWKTLSFLASQSLFYVGMQMMEPFGMSTAEAMAAKTPVMISKAAGITRWLEQGQHALIVDPQNPRQAAKELVKAVKNEDFLQKLSINGYRLARERFSWVSIARDQGKILDALHQGKKPQVMNIDREFYQYSKCRAGIH